MDIKHVLSGRTGAKLVYNKTTKEILGLFYEWRKDNPNVSIFRDSEFGTFEIGTLAKGRHDKETILSLGLEKIHQAMLKKADDDARAKHAKALPEAEKRLDECEALIKEALKKTGCDLSYKIEGDIYGIDKDYQYISVFVDGCYFERVLD